MTDEASDTVAQLTAILGWLDGLHDQERHVNLVAFARSAWFHVCLCLLEGRQGAVVREAAKALAAELKAPTAGRRWSDISYSQHRGSIKRMMVGDESARATYACLPFRVDADGLVYAAVGIERIFAGQSEAEPAWCHLDITDVIVWHRRANTVRLVEDAPGERGLVVPYVIDPSGSVAVYDNPSLFFHDWVKRRLEIHHLWELKREGRWAYPVTEPRDGGLPGILAIGGVVGQPWFSCGAAHLQPTGRMNPRRLQDAIIASANLPTVREGFGARGR